MKYSDAHPRVLGGPFIAGTPKLIQLQFQNGKLGVFHVDDGSDMTLLDARFAELAKIPTWVPKERPNITVNTAFAGSRGIITKAAIASAKIVGADWLPEEAIWFDVAKIEGFNGILGSSWLIAMGIDIHGPELRLRCNGSVIPQIASSDLRGIRATLRDNDPQRPL